MAYRFLRKVFSLTVAFLSTLSFTQNSIYIIIYIHSWVCCIQRKHTMKTTLYHVSITSMECFQPKNALSTRKTN